MQKVNFENLKGNAKETKNTHINIGTGEDLTIKELAKIVKNVVGFEGKIEWDKTKPDGTRQKMLDVSKINRLGWKEKTNFYDGLKLVYSNYLGFK